MRYDLPNLYFTNGTTAINPGDTVVWTNGSGIVQGTPEITSGSWAGGNATGKIRFASVTGNFTFANNESLKVLGTTVAILNGATISPQQVRQIISPKQLNPSLRIFPRPVIISDHFCWFCGRRNQMALSAGWPLKILLMMTIPRDIKTGVNLMEVALLAAMEVTD